MKPTHFLVIGTCLVLSIFSTQLTIPASNLLEVVLSAIAYSVIGLFAVVVFLCASILFELAMSIRKRISSHVASEFVQESQVESRVESKVESKIRLPAAQLITDPDVIRMIENAIA